MDGHKPFDLNRRAPGWNAEPGNLGFPQVRAENLVPPTEFVLTESASLFKEIMIPRAARLYVPGQKRVFRAVPLRLKYAGATQIALGLFAPSQEGFIELAPGTWHINTPIVAAEGTDVTAVYHDASFAIPNLLGSDSGQQITMLAAGAPVGVTNASGLKLAARTGRRFLYIHASNFAGGCSRVTLWFLSPAVDRRGIILSDGSWRAWNYPEAVAEAAVYAITDAGTADLTFGEGV